MGIGAPAIYWCTSEYHPTYVSRGIVHIPTFNNNEIDGSLGKIAISQVYLLVRSSNSHIAKGGKKLW